MGVPSSVVSDRDNKFKSKFWHRLREAFGTLLCFSTAFHAATDGQIECTIQTLEDIIRARALDFENAWDKQLVLIEFFYNNRYYVSISTGPYEALYGRKCRTLLCWQDIDKAFTIGSELIQATTDKIRMIQERMRATQSR